MFGVLYTVCTQAICLVCAFLMAYDIDHFNGKFNNFYKHILNKLVSERISKSWITWKIISIIASMDSKDTVIEICIYLNNIVNG